MAAGMRARLSASRHVMKCVGVQWNIALCAYLSANDADVVIARLHLKRSKGNTSCHDALMFWNMRVYAEFGGVYDRKYALCGWEECIWLMVAHFGCKSSSFLVLTVVLYFRAFCEFLWLHYCSGSIIAWIGVMYDATCIWWNLRAFIF